MQVFGTYVWHTRVGVAVGVRKEGSKPTSIGNCILRERRAQSSMLRLKNVNYNHDG